MKQFMVFACLVFLASCSSNSGSEDLTRYREQALRYLVKERIKVDISNPRFEEISTLSLPGWPLMIFQGDNVDRSRVSFRIEGKKDSQTIVCGLYIREKASRLAINLKACNGSQAKKLSGSTEYGLPLLEVDKSALRP